MVHWEPRVRKSIEESVAAKDVEVQTVEVRSRSSRASPCYISNQLWTRFASSHYSTYAIALLTGPCTAAAEIMQLPYLTA